MIRLIPRLRKPTWFDFAQALERAGRAFVVAFIALYPLGNLASSVSEWAGGGDVAVIDIELAKKAGVAGLMAAGAFLWRWLLPDVGRSVVATTAHVPDGEETPSHITSDAATND